MRVFFTFVAALLLSLSAFSQTFNGTGGNIPPLATTQTCFSTTVTGIGVINGSLGLASVCMNITHGDVGDLEIVLRSPDGTVVPLTMQNGGNGNNYATTCFTATATQPIKFGTAPFNGSFLPEGHLGAVNNGQNANGTWSLCILDRRNGSGTGTVNSWSLTFSNTTPAPPPPALPACAVTLPSSSSCATATQVCDFNGLCGSTAAPSVQTWPALTAASCFSLQNNSFIRFTAAATTASFSVWIPTTIRPNYLDGGLQMLFFSGTCNGPVTTYGCYEHIYPNSGTGQPTISVISASGLTPGNTYYLMIDGYNGDNCTFTIAANTGVNILNITPAAPAICAGQSVNLTATGGNGTYTWSPPTNLNTTTGATVTATPPAGSHTYTVSSTTATGCPLTKDVTVTVNPLPAAPTGSVTVQPTCTTPTGTITITAPAGAGLQYSVNGGPYQASPVFTGLTPGSYNVTVQNAAGCTSPVTILTVNAAPVPPSAPTVVVTQPTCQFPTGSVQITAPTGAGYQYSINGGPYQVMPGFSGLAPGNYIITVRDGAGCISAGTPVTINAVPPTPPVPTAIVVQPNCLNPTSGSVTVTSPLGPQYLYRLPPFAITFQASPLFNNVPQGMYTLIVVDVANPDCFSSLPVTIGSLPPPPQVPTGTIDQPTCTVPTGTITITSPVGTVFQYSINGGPYQSSPVFSGLVPNSYIVTVRDPGFCTTASQPFVVNPPTGAPAAPTATVTAQPTCTTPTGTITITAPLGAGLQYSINGGPYQASPVFSGLTPAIYSITVQNAAGCTSPATIVTVNTAPTAPAAPSAGVTTQPTCTTPTGIITISAPLGAGLQYNINGGPYQASPVFAGLTPGTYTLTVQNAAGCTSPVTTLTVAAVPTAPAAPIATVTAQPTCTTPTGTITVSAPTGAGLQYSIGGPYQASPVFSGLNPNSYSVTVSNTATGCISSATIVTVSAAPAAQPGPLNITTVQPDCTTPTGTIILTPPPGSNLEFSINGTTYQSATTFNNVPPGIYNVTVRNTVTGCISIATQITVSAAPVLPTTPTGTVSVQPTCTIATGTISITSPLGANYEYSLSGAPYQASPVFSNLAPGTYFVTVRNIISGCVSPQLTPLVVNAAPTPPATATATTLQPNCARPDGTITVTAPVGAGLEYNINGGTYQTSPVFTGLAPGNYDVKVRNAAGCVSAGTIVVINTALAQPAKPVVTQTQPSCPARVGEIRVDAPIGIDIEYSINGTTYQTSNIFPNLPGGNYNVTARFIGSNCVSQVTAVQILGLTPEQCLLPANGDIYFPSAFTPNGDGKNDGFGPGPRSVLGNVTGYTLMVFNRYGEKVFETNNPLAQWDGRYKGKLLANYSYTWVAKYRYGTRNPQMQKGSVTIIR